MTKCSWEANKNFPITGKSQAFVSEKKVFPLSILNDTRKNCVARHFPFEQRAFLPINFDEEEFELFQIEKRKQVIKHPTSFVEDDNRNESSKRFLKIKFPLEMMFARKSLDNRVKKN